MVAVLHFSLAGECVKAFANNLAACKRGEQRASLKSCRMSLLLFVTALTVAQNRSLMGKLLDWDSMVYIL